MSYKPREVVLENPKIKAIIEQKRPFAKEIVDITEQIKELENKREKLMHKLSRYDTKVKPLIEEEIKKIELGEYEMFGNVSVVEEETLLQVIDKIEEYKEFLRLQAEEAKKKKEENDTSNEDKAINR